VSGNISLYNNNGTDSINPSALISCVGKLDNAAEAIPQQFQQAGNILLLVGERSGNLGGSEFEKAIKKKLGEPFQIDVLKFSRESKFVLAAKKNIVSSRDLHRGGILVAAAEQSFGSGFGFEIQKLPTAQLFSENPGYLLEIEVKNFSKLKKLAAKLKVKITKVGKVNNKPEVALEKIWSESLRKILQG